MEDTLSSPKMEPVIGVKEILDILPHRYPFLLVDKVVSIDLEASTILAQKNVSFNEEFFQGHFPGAPIMPGVLMLEALAQTGGILVHQKGYKDKSAVILNVSNAKFRNSVKPGDVLMIHAEGVYVSSKGGRIKGRGMIGDKVAFEAELSFALCDKNQI
ncbi:MAG: 3-hydroxyacyl-[acyl-carrier-protein] dehydratase FabZ [Chlamydiae bacterium]|nr:3-hydroxyacyl-[acyl-carrier-protein] dehydratase FabZ [Chlamydiota bacterium]